MSLAFPVSTCNARHGLHIPPEGGSGLMDAVVQLT